MGEHKINIHVHESMLHRIVWYMVAAYPSDVSSSRLQSLVVGGIEQPQPLQG